MQVIIVQDQVVQEELVVEVLEEMHQVLEVLLELQTQVVVVVETDQEMDHQAVQV